MAAGLRRRRPGAGRGALVSGGDRAAASSAGQPTGAPLPGPVSNIASWNYPMSVQVHAELVQLLAGNAVVAKTPSQGGFPLPDPGARADAPGRAAGHPAVRRGRPARRGADPQRGHRRAGVRRRPGQRPPGGRVAGRHRPAAHARAGGAQHLGHLGLLASGTLLAAHLRKGFEYAKQRCTAYPRYVVQRRLFPAFLRCTCRWSRRCGSATRSRSPTPAIRCPTWTSARSSTPAKAARPARARSTRRVPGGGIPLYRGTLDRRRVPRRPGHLGLRRAGLPCWSRRRRWSLHHAEPFGPLDSIVVVDTEAELLAAMNASNGSLVASIATDDADFAARVAEQLQAFKVGINKPR